MNYLKYIEHAAENLQFFLWYRDYTARFANLPESERVLSPEWTPAQAEAAAASAKQARSKKSNGQSSSIFKNTDFADSNATTEKSDPFNTPPKTPSLNDKHDMTSEYGSSTGDDTLVSSSVARSTAGHAFTEAGKLQPCTPQILL